MSRGEHWQAIYAKSPSDGLSWFQASPDVSTGLIEKAGLLPGT